MGRTDVKCYGPAELALGAGTLGPAGRQLIAAIGVEAHKRGLVPPVIISACRTYDEQLELLERWLGGDREGIAYRPADPGRSKHVPDGNGICWAFDVGNSRRWIDEIGPWVARTLGWATWGGTWLPPDRRHFQVEEDRYLRLVGVWKIT